MSEELRRGMSRWGIGTPFTLWSVGYAGSVCYVHYRWLPDLDMIWPPPTIGMAMAILLFGAGLVIHIAGVRRLNQAWAEDRLETRGIYAWVRHPIYSAFVVFYVPAAVLLSRSVICLTIPIFMYIVFRILIRREEAYLAERFGEKYRQWCGATGAVIPAPPMNSD